MAKLKTWKRDASIVDPNWDGRTNAIVLIESDYRKMRAVYNAAMKWHELPYATNSYTSNARTQHDEKLQSILEKLEKACERARK